MRDYKSFGVPRDIFIAQIKYKQAIYARKEAEAVYLEALRVAMQLLHDCPSLFNIDLETQAQGKLHKALIVAIDYEIECCDRLNQLRKERNFYE